MTTKSDFQIAERNSNWKGDDVGLCGLHSWVRRRIPKPENCQRCGEAGFIELSCLDHIYTRDLERWKYLCRSCHSAIDEKILNITNYRKTKICICGQEISSNRKHCLLCSRQARLNWWKEYNLKRGHTKGYGRAGRPRKEQEMSGLR